MFHSSSHARKLLLIVLSSSLITRVTSQDDEVVEVTTPILSSRCPPAFVEWKTKCYFYVQQPMSFDNANSYCKDAFNGTLAVFDSFNQQKFTNDFLFGTLKLFTPVWIGLRGGKLRDISTSKSSHATHEGENDNEPNSFGSKEKEDASVTMAWVDGTKYDFENWAPGEPIYEVRSRGSPTGGSHNCVTLGAVLDTTGKWQITNCILDYGALCQVDANYGESEHLPRVPIEGSSSNQPSNELNEAGTNVISLNWILIASIILLLVILLFLVLLGDYDSLFVRFRYLF